MSDRAASGTAILIAQCRAAADGRLLPGVFSDPVSREFLRPFELTVVDQVRSEVAPRKLSDRLQYDLVRTSAALLAARTVAIDEAVIEAGNPQVVLLGAGLDARAWRLAPLARAAVFEVDHPASQTDKRARVDNRSALAGSLHWVPVDFASADLGPELQAAGHRTDWPTTWVWEGVLPYLAASDVAATLTVLGRRSAPSSRLIVDYERVTLSLHVALRVFAAVSWLSGRTSFTTSEPRRSSWSATEMARLLADHGFLVATDDDLLTLVTRQGLTPEGRRQMAALRLAISDRRH